MLNQERKLVPHVGPAPSGRKKFLLIELLTHLQHEMLDHLKIEYLNMGQIGMEVHSMKKCNFLLQV